MRRALAFVAFAAVIVLDRLTELWAIRLPEPGPFSFGTILTTTHHQNIGLIADVPLPLWSIFIIVVAVMILVLTALVIADRQHKTVDMLALSLILGGAIGNLWDRIAWGYVFDWILLFHTSIINLADVAVGLGLLLYVVNRGRVTKPAPLDSTPKNP